MRHRYLVAYDISDPKRWRQVYKTMNGFGDPLQYSVFLCRLDKLLLVELRAKLADAINLREDRVAIADLGPDEGRGQLALELLGKPRVEPPPPGPRATIL